MQHAGRCATVLTLLLVAATQAAAQTGPPLGASTSDRDVYLAACANCHAADGTGAPATAVAFEEPLPDFTECTFATREPDADWFAVVHAGGPVRGFSRMMPAFGAALTEDEIQQALDYVRTLCDDPAWPRGELNLPRAFVTEKAYPEDEAVWTTSVAADGPGAVMNEIVYEKRFGARNQIEIAVPFGGRARAADDASGWTGGLGDVALGFKRALYHSLARGSIFSAAAELILPTGKQDEGFGSGTTIFEPFVAFGQILPADAFLHLQGGVELPFDTERAEREGFWRGVLGITFAEAGGFGRAWTPMVEVLGSRPFESGATAHWDVLPQLQVTLNTRQHVIANVGVRVPVNDTAGRPTQLLVYVLWDWFDGGLFDGW